MIESHAGICCACLPSMKPLVRLLLYGSFTVPSRPYPRRNDYSKETTSQGTRSHGRPEPGDNSRDMTFDYLHNKPGFHTRIKSVPPGTTHAQQRTDTANDSLPRINVRREVAVDYIELGPLRFATQGQHEDYDVEHASEKDLLR